MIEEIQVKTILILIVLLVVKHLSERLLLRIIYDNKDLLKGSSVGTNHLTPANPGNHIRIVQNNKISQVFCNCNAFDI